MWFSVACFWCQSSMMFYHILFIILLVRFWLLSDDLLRNYCPLRFAICAHCILCDFGYFPLWFWERNFPSDYSSSCSLLSHYFYNGRYVVATLAPSFLIESSSFLQVMRTCILARMSINFFQIAQLTMELSALECLKNWHITLWQLQRFHF